MNHWNRRRQTSCLSALALLLLLAGCSTLHVSTDWDRGADFSRYRTFRWAPTPGDEDSGSLLDTHVRRAVTDELVAKGLESRASAPSDLLLVYRMGTRDRVDVYRHSRYWGPSSVHRYREGTLTLRMVDPTADRVIWEGVADGVDVSHGESADEIRRAVAEVLAGFPPAP